MSQIFPTRPLSPRRWATTVLAVLLFLPLAACGHPEADAEQRADGEADRTAAQPAEQAAERQDAESDDGFFGGLFDPGPSEVTVRAGTLLPVRFDSTLSSHTTPVGQQFSATVTQEISVDSETAIPVGSRVLGTVTEATPGKKIGGRARLSLSFDSVELPSGERVPIAAAFAQRGRSETPKDAAIIAGGTLGGAILGEAIDKGEGGIIGAVVGGLAGAAGAAKTKGRPVEIPAGTAMTLELTSDTTVTL